MILRVQNELFDVGADLATPVVADPPYPPLRVTQDYIDRLEADCDAFNAELPALTSFILPGGTPAARCCTWRGRWPGGPNGAPGRCAPRIPTAATRWRRPT